MRPGLLCSSRDQVEHALDNDLEQFRIIYQPGIDEKQVKLLQAEMEYICDIARTVRDVALFVDEIDSFGEWDRERLALCIPSLHAVVNFGRKKEIDVYATVRRPQVTIPRVWVTESQTIAIFKTLDPYDLTFISRECRRRISEEEIEALQEWECFEYSRMRGEVKKMVVSPDF